MKQEKLQEMNECEDVSVRPVMMPMSIGEIAQAVSGRIVSSSRNDETACADLNESVALAVSTDSREIVAGTVFVAIAGEHVDGHDYVERAAQLGAPAAIVEREVFTDTRITQIIVHDSVAALGQLAKHNLERRRALSKPFTIIGITGSVGKTTTKDMLRALLSKQGETVAPVGSFNNNIGLPLTALRVGVDTRFLVAEMGANHVGEIAELTRIAPPNIAIVLKVGVAHLGEFGSVERIAQAKSEIVQGLLPNGIAVLNADDIRVRPMAQLVDVDCVQWFSSGLLGACKDADQLHNVLSATDIQSDETGCPIFTICECSGSQDMQQVRVHLAIPGEHNVMNALAASCVARLCGVSLVQISEVLSGLQHISPHRMQCSRVCNAAHSFMLIDDSFNANPDSMKAGINGLCSYESLHNSDTLRIAVLGSMLELGDNEDRLHYDIGRYAAEHAVDAVIAVGSCTDQHLDKLASALAQGARDTWHDKRFTASSMVHWVHNVDEADSLVWSLVSEHPSSVVLLKGSHASGLSALAERWERLEKVVCDSDDTSSCTSETERTEGIR